LRFLNKFYIGFDELVCGVVLEMSVHGSKGVENNVWHRFHELLVSAVIIKRAVFGSWNNAGRCDAKVHHSVVNCLVVVLEKTMKKIGPSHKALLASISQISKSIILWQSLNLTHSSTAAALSHGITTNGNSDLIAHLWRRNLEIEFLTWEKCFLAIAIGLVIAFFRQFNLKLVLYLCLLMP